MKEGETVVALIALVLALDLKWWSKKRKKIIHGIREKRGESKQNGGKAKNADVSVGAIE